RDMSDLPITARDEDLMGLAREARLRYICGPRPGLRRKRWGTGFRYIDADGNHVNGSELHRIRELGIPPGREHVWICPRPDGHVQATGRDARGRKQYIYHSQWHAVRN